MTQVIDADAASEAIRSAELRAGMVDELKKNGEIRSASIEAVMRKVAESCSPPRRLWRRSTRPSPPSSPSETTRATP